MNLQTDYLVIGAGVTGLCFTDELVTRRDAHITLVDQRDAPGGHWNDAYSFVKLHQPSLFYGVESKALAEYRIDETGPNKGFLSLAEGPEITSYCHSVMRDRLLPSGRVDYRPLTTVESDGSLRSMLSGDRHTITVRKKIVDASYYTNSIPLTHTRNFDVAPGVTCVPPNDLPRRAASFKHYTVLGAGKTAMDTCIWLLTHGAPDQAITWIVPRDAWFVNRAKTQPGAAYFNEVFEGFAALREAIAMAASAQDLAHRLEAAGLWLRLDPEIEPTMFHAAALSAGELIELRRISNTIRLGRVLSIRADRLVLERGEIQSPPDSLYIDCTASALRPRPLLPVFDGNRINLQLVRFPQIPFSAALIAFLEATLPDDDEEKNRFVAPIPLTNSLEDYLTGLAPDMKNRLHCARHPLVREWVNNSRLDGYSKIVRDIDPLDTEKQEILKRIKRASIAAFENLPRLLGQAARNDH